MDKQDKKLQSKRRLLDDKINLVIRIGMKKVEAKNNSNVWERNSANQTSSNDTNNNESINSVKKIKKDLPSLAMSVKNLFNKSSSSSSSSGGDKNNNPVVPPTTNQYTKVSVDALASLHQILPLESSRSNILNGNNNIVSNQTDPSNSGR